MVDLSSELKAAAGNVRQPVLDAMLKLGVSGRTIADLGSRQFPFGVMPGKIDHEGAFVPEEGPMHLIQPVMEGGEIIDLVAWASARPDRWGLRIGTGWALGLENVIEPGGWDAPSAHLVATPLDWLRGGAVATVILNWDAPEIEGLRYLGDVVCSDATVAGLLHAALSRPPLLPNISVMEGLRHAA